MADLKLAKTQEEIKRLGVAATRDAYYKLADDYNKILNKEMLLCPVCGDFLKADTGFYLDKTYATNRYPECKQCIQAEVEQRKNKNDRAEPKETKESVQKVLQKMNKIYDDDFYNDCIKGAKDQLGEKNRHSPFSIYITSIQSLPNWRGKTWKDSRFGIDQPDKSNVKINQKTLKSAQQRFGSYSDEDLMFLENQYQDWVTRYECNTKAQEEIFERLSFKKLEIHKATKAGQPTKDLDKTYQELLTTANITPRQTGMDALADAQTFGTLIKKYEETRPLPEIDPELSDVDKIGVYFDVFFRGHTSKMMGIKNTFSHLYEKFIKKYSVEKYEYNEEEDSEALYEKIFGSVNED